jgi:pSer/pThr/pTyr-binding forkhead associated (FHA) protein
VDQDQKTLQAEIGTGQAFHAFRLTVLDGPESGRSLTIDGSQPGPWLLGHAEGCHLRLTDQRVSRRHVSCEHIGTAVRCVDQRSLNGTLVNGLRIESCLLRGGERIAIGDTTIFVEALGDAPTGLPVVTGFGGALGASLEMRRLYPLLSKLAKSDVPLLIEGETGTGKEAVAKAIHSESRRASGPFVVLDCTSTPASLFESELLGHEKGAFTGAMQTRRGCMEMARGGTLFIEE